jgi:hypothetical protein
MNIGDTQNWGSAAVRDYKTAMLNDVITIYKPDGISLDFLRAPLFFDASTTTSAQRHAIMGDWVRSLKQRMSEGGVPVLAARVPPSWSTLDAIGVDLVGLVADGTFDYVTLGVNYDSFMPMEQDTAAIIADIHRSCAHTIVMCVCVCVCVCVCLCVCVCACVRVRAYTYGRACLRAFDISPPVDQRCTRCRCTVRGHVC